MRLLFVGLAFAVGLQTSPQPAQTARLSGVVLEEGTNLPVAGARVTIAPTDEPPPDSGGYPETMSDADGRWTFDSIAPRRYRIVVTKRDFAPPAQGTPSAVVDLGGNQGLTNVTIVLSHGSVITGRVLDRAGNPLPGRSTVALLRRFGINSLSDRPENGPLVFLPFGRSETDARGEFRITTLPPGEYSLAVDPARTSRPGFRSPTYYPGTLDRLAAGAVIVQKGQTVSDVTIRVVPTFQVSGVTTDANGKPVAHAIVRLRFPNEPPVDRIVTGDPGTAQSDANGAFALPDIAPGSYTLVVVSGEGETTFTVKDADVSNVKLVVRNPF